MKEILDKITSYNIFNNLLPGVVFVYVLKKFTGYNLIQDDTIAAAFLYYFIGMVVSRFGSIFIQPFLEWVRFIEFDDYKNFVSASKLDNKIELLSEVNNSYRTIVALFTLLLMSKGYKILIENFQISDNASIFIIVILIFLLFVFSYRKQTNFITKRIKINIP